MEYFWLSSILVFLVHAGYFYGNYSLLYPKFFKKGRYGLYFISVLYLTFLHYIGLIWIWTNFSAFDAELWASKVAGATGASSIFFSISFGWNLIEGWVESIVKKVKLEKALKRAELDFLKSQINPHFLFNVLGCINGLALIKSAETATAINNLKELIKSSIVMKTGEQVPLNEEISFLTSFIHLHQIRYSVPVQLNLPIDNIREYTIEPMLILPLVENAFKHGNVSDSGDIKIVAKLKDSWLSVEVENKVLTAHENKEKGGIGDENVKKRLAFAYADCHSIEVENLPENYKVKMTLKLEKIA